MSHYDTPRDILRALSAVKQALGCHCLPLLSPALIDHLQLFFDLGEVASLTFTQLRAPKCPWRYSWASPVPSRGSRGSAGSLSEPRRWPRRHLPRPGERPEGSGDPGPPKVPARPSRARVRRRARAPPVKDTRGRRRRLSLLLQAGPGLPEQRPRPAPLPLPRTTPASPSPAATGSPPPGPQLRAAFAAWARSPRHGPRPLWGRGARALRRRSERHLPSASAALQPARPTPLPLHRAHGTAPARAARWEM